MNMNTKNTKLGKKELQSILNEIKTAPQGILKTVLKQKFPVNKVVKALDILNAKGIITTGLYHEKGFPISRVIVLNA